MSARRLRPHAPELAPDDPSARSAALEVPLAAMRVSAAVRARFAGDTHADVARYLAVPLRIVEDLAAGRAFPVLRIGAERRVRWSDLEAFLRRVEE